MTALRTVRVHLFVAGALALAAIVGLPPRSAGAQRNRGFFSSEYRSRIDTAVAFDKDGTVTLIAGSGDIIVNASNNGQVHVLATSDDDNLRFDASRSNLTLEVGGGRRGGDSRFEVSVPQGVRVVARSVSGDITIRGTHGEVEVHAINGDAEIEDVGSRLTVASISGGVTASNVAGDVEIATTSGDVKLENVRGDADITSVSGDVELRGITAKSARVKTTSGDVIYDGLIDPAGRYDLTTHSGDIRLHVQRDASAQLSVSTWNGGIDSEFPITLQPGEHGIGSAHTKRFTFAIGGGAARITAETFSGDITVSANGKGAR